MTKKAPTSESLSEIHQSVKVATTGSKWKRFLGFFGPAYLISVGYMDPGNWATDLAGGSKYGYALLWVLLMSNLMALLLQSHSARLGIVRGRDLAQANREVYPKKINFVLYLLAEIGIAACDLAEVLGMAIGIYLLTGLPLIWGVSITILDTFLLLFLQKYGVRKMEAFIISLVSIIALCFLYNVIIASPQLSQVVKGLIPSLPSAEDLYKEKGILGKLPTESALYLAIGIIGATVMPHNLYLHSALVQTRKIEPTDDGIKQALRFNFLDTTIALNIAFFVNAAILVLAASVFFVNNRTDVAELKEAHQLLPQILNSDITAKFFAIALIASGQSSTITGTLAGQIVMEGYLKLRINPWARRLLTRLLAIVPAFLTILLSGDHNVDALLVLSQVILSMQLGFAIIPLILFVSDKATMGKFAIGPIAKILSWLIATVLIFLNVKMLFEQSIPVFANGALWQKALIVVSAVGFGYLLLYTIIYPIYTKNKKQSSIRLHPKVEALEIPTITSFATIAIALEFGQNDMQLFAYAKSVGTANAKFVLIHIVESATAKIHGSATKDFETKKDMEQMDFYVKALRNQGYDVEGKLGFRNRNKEIVRLVKESESNVLIVGSHGHKGIKDILYGQTINSVRHQLQIPVLVVNV
jgi:manganese transport protein